MTHHPNCCCVNRAAKHRTETTDLGSKLAARLLLTDKTRKIIIPSEEEWIGVGMLFRDDEQYDLKLT